MPRTNICLSSRSLLSILRSATACVDRSNHLSSNVADVSQVIDVNDCDPEFQWPSRGNETLIISSRTPRGYPIARLRATDRDSGINANLTYYLVLSEGGPTSGGGNAGGAASLRQSPFIVVPDTGAIVVTADLSKL